MSGFVPLSRPRTVSSDPTGPPDASSSSSGDAEPAGGTIGRDWLYRVIRAVSQGPDPGRVLGAVVELLADATACACRVHLREGDRMVLRAASRTDAAAVGHVSFGTGDGVCGRVVRHGEPVVVGPDASSEERAAAVPGIPGDRFRSMVAVPLPDREGAVLGVVVLDTAERREFRPEVVEFLEHVASLVAGTVENARLHEGELRRAEALDRLAALVGRIATVTDRGELVRATCDGTLGLLAADRCRLHLVDPEDGAARVVAQARAGAGAAVPEDPPDPPADAAERGVLAAQVAAGDAGEGVLSVERDTPFRTHERRMLETVAAQLAVALRTIGLVERLTEENVVRDLFGAIAAGRGEQVAAHVRSARIDPDGPHVVVVFEPRRPDGPWATADRLEARLRHLVPGVLCDPGAERLRVLLPVPPGSGGTPGLPALDVQLDVLAREEDVVAGRSSVQPRLAADRSSLVEAEAATRIARALAPGGGLRAWEALGAYRYLAGVGQEVEPDARHARAVGALWRYDERRGSELVRTLERYLADRSVVPTARALLIHANTLRQRLERIEHLTGLVLAEEDLVSLELAIKLHRLRAPDRDDAA